MLDNNDKKWLNELFDTRFEEQNQRIDAKFEEQDKRIDAKFAEHDKRFDQIDARLDEHDKRFDQIDARLNEHDKRFDQIDARFDEHDKRFDQIDARLDEHDEWLDNSRAEADRQYHRFVKILDRRTAELRKDMDTRFAAMMEATQKQNENFIKECTQMLDNKIEDMDRRFIEHERHIEVLIENKIETRLDAFAEYLPGAYKSYGQLEERVDSLEIRQNVLECAVMDHINGA